MRIKTLSDQSACYPRVPVLLEFLPALGKSGDLVISGKMVFLFTMVLRRVLASLFLQYLLCCVSFES